MINFKELLKKQNQNQLILMCVLLLYVLFDTPIPSTLKPFFNNMLGQIIAILIALSLLIYYNPILGVLSMYVVFLMLQKSYSAEIPKSKPVVTEEEKNLKMHQMNNKVKEQQESLEFDMVNKMTPFVSNLNFSNPSYKPVLEDNVQGSNL